MVSRVYCGTLKGITSQLVDVEVSTSRGLRAFNIVGLADKAIEEAKERINSAIKSIGLVPPNSQTQRVLVNLAPADIKKEGSFFDLPIALGYLLSTNQTNFNAESKMFAGELALNGKLKPITGTLLLALLASENQFSEIIIPIENLKEASLVNLLNKGIKVLGAENIKDIIDYLENRKKLEECRINEEEITFCENFSNIDFAFIKGQEYAKRGLEIAASGNHNIFLEGPPGAGKTMLAKSVISILPKLEPKEILELTKIYSIAGLLSSKNPFVNKRPFRNPHHTTSETALIGGGVSPRPGEITLSHRGILFLDEFPEFHRDVLESLRQPVEQREINIIRAKYNITFPCSFTLIASANPCPCGFFRHPEKECSCSTSQIASYKRKMSGPLLDRIDLFCWVPSLKYQDLAKTENEEPSCEIRKRVEKARKIQKQRFKNQDILTNSEMSIPLLKEHCFVDKKSQDLLKRFIDSGELSARGFHRVLKVARTIADLNENENISFDDLTEAISYRKRSN